MNTIYEQVVAGLTAIADPEKAVPMSAYMRGQFPFLGVYTPQRRAVAHGIIQLNPLATAAESIECARQLWEAEEREYQYVAIDLLTHYHLLLGHEHISTILGLAVRKPWWDTVDNLASLVGKILKRLCVRQTDTQHYMDAAIREVDSWVRRIAMLHQLGWRHHTDTERLFQYACSLSSEKNFFIEKAIGWALRDYAKHDAVPVANLLSNQDWRFSATTIRAATKYRNSTRGATENRWR